MHSSDLGTKGENFELTIYHQYLWVRCWISIKNTLKGNAIMTAYISKIDDYIMHIIWKGESQCTNDDMVWILHLSCSACKMNWMTIHILTNRNLTLVYIQFSSYLHMIHLPLYIFYKISPNLWNRIMKCIFLYPLVSVLCYNFVRRCWADFSRGLKVQHLWEITKLPLRRTAVRHQNNHTKTIGILLLSG